MALETRKFDKKQIKVIAHRGLSAFETENTLGAFIAAGNKSYYGIETDVHVTKDGKFVIIHDDNLLRSAGIDMCIEDSLYDDLKKVKLYDVDAGVLDGDGTVLTKNKRTDLLIPDLDEYVNVCKKYGKQAILEIKNPMTETNIKDIIDICEKCEYFKGVTFISFCIENLVILKTLRPDADVQFLSCNREDFAKKLPTVLQYKMDVDLGYWLLTEDDVKDLHAKNIKINVWTPSKIEDAKKLDDWGVEFITSNILE
jgi:glycerophosphoryl diester phosphodiesterase